jgi:hypothetical protein
MPNTWEELIDLTRCQGSTKREKEPEVVQENIIQTERFQSIMRMSWKVASPAIRDQIKGNGTSCLSNWNWPTYWRFSPIGRLSKGQELIQINKDLMAKTTGLKLQVETTMFVSCATRSTGIS